MSTKSPPTRDAGEAVQPAMESADTAPGGAVGNGGRMSLLQMVSPSRISAIYLLLLFILIFGLITPSTFLTETTFQLVTRQGVVTCLLALAFLVPLVAGVYDLAIGALMSLAVAIVVYLNLHTGLAPGVLAVIAVLGCMLAGAVSGFVVVRLRVSSFIATLAMSQVLLAVVLLISGNRQLVGSFPSSWQEAGNGTVFGIPYAFGYLLVVALILWFVLDYTRAGRYLFATGGNSEAARLSGVPVNRLQWASLVASGGIAALAGVIYSMQTGVYNSSVGPGYLFPAIAAVFLGGSQFSRRPNVWGTLIAYFALAFGVQGLQLSNSSAAVWTNPLFQGVALIIAVWLAVRPAKRVYRRQQARKGSVDSGGAAAGASPSPLPGREASESQ